MMFVYLLRILYLSFKIIILVDSSTKLKTNLNLNFLLMSKYVMFFLKVVYLAYILNSLYLPSK